jgi:hypothetical protein
MNAYQIVRVLLDADLKSVDAATVLGRKYTVLPMTRTDCDCEDCRAGKHLYELFRWTAGQWQSVAWSLQGYGSAEECKKNHYWGVAFQPGDTWEDGTPIVRPEDRRQTQPKTKEPGPRRMVPLDTDALRKSAEALKKHWL